MGLHPLGPWPSALARAPGAVRVAASHRTRCMPLQPLQGLGSTRPAPGDAPPRLARRYRWSWCRDHAVRCRPAELRTGRPGGSGGGAASPAWTRRTGCGRRLASPCAAPPRVSALRFPAVGLDLRGQPGTAGDGRGRAAPRRALRGGPTSPRCSSDEPRAVRAIALNLVLPDREERRVYPTLFFRALCGCPLLFHAHGVRDPQPVW